jgi:hypothetical protein
VARRCMSVLVLSVAVFAVAGCGQPEPAGPFPQRPITVDLERFDPCEAVTADQRYALGLSPGRPPGSPLIPAPSRGCGWSDFDSGYNLTVQTLPVPASDSAGAEGTRLTAVAGFGAVEGTGNGDTAPLCQLVIDTSDTGALRIQAQSVRYGDDDRPRNLDDVCGRASDFAEIVLQNIPVP